MPLTPDEKTIFDICLPHLPHDAILFDVGAYKGEWTIYAKQKTPSAYFYLFESNSMLCDDLIKTFKPKEAFICNFLVSESNGLKSFYRCAGTADEMSSSYKRKIFSQVHTIEEKVKSVSIGEFCSYSTVNSIDFLKIDVEGAEFDVLKGCDYMLSMKSIRFIQVEYGGTYPDAGITFKEVITFVNQYGYNVYELIDDKLQLITADTFVEDYRFANFLITHIDICLNQK